MRTDKVASQVVGQLTSNRTALLSSDIVNWRHAFILSYYHMESKAQRCARYKCTHPPVILQQFCAYAIMSDTEDVVDVWDNAESENVQAVEAEKARQQKLVRWYEELRSTKLRSAGGIWESFDPVLLRNKEGLITDVKLQCTLCPNSLQHRTHPSLTKPITSLECAVGALYPSKPHLLLIPQEHRCQLLAPREQLQVCIFE